MRTKTIFLLALAALGVTLAVNYLGHSPGKHPDDQQRSQPNASLSPEDRVLLHYYQDSRGVSNNAGVSSAEAKQAVAALSLPANAAFNWPPAPVEGQKKFFTIAENGKARCVLVVPYPETIIQNYWGDIVRDENAAAILQLYLRLATGATNDADFKIYGENDQIPGDFAQIHIGGTKAAKQVTLAIPPLRYGTIELPNFSGFLVKTVSTNLLVIRGMRPEGNVPGVVGFLKRYLGIRRYWPGEAGGIGDVVPKAATLKLPQIEWRDWPYFISRFLSGLADRGPRNGYDCFADFWRLSYTLPCNESYPWLMNASAHTNEPELFPLINGKRYVPADPSHAGGWQPCVSNPKVAQIMAATLIEKFRKNPWQIAESLSVNDAMGDCTCEKCRAMADRYYNFDNQVAELVSREFPDRLLVALAYESAAAPPKTVKMHPMLMVSAVVWGNAFNTWDWWQNVGLKHMGVYFYHNDECFILPKMDVHQFARRLRYMVDSGMARGFYQEYYGIYPLDGMVGYVEQELLWDPRQDVDRILDEFYTGFFGRASTPMKAFYETLEAGYNQWVDKVGISNPAGKDYSLYEPDPGLQQFAVLPLELADRAEGNITAALTAARADPLVTERVKLVKALFDFALPGARAYWATGQLTNITVNSLADMEKVLTASRQAIDSSLALADYKFAVIEQPAIKVYEGHGDAFYQALQKGSVAADVLQKIDTAFGKVSDYLKTPAGSAAAKEWWQAQEEKETRPLLKNLMKKISTG